MDLEQLNNICSQIMAFYNYNLKSISLYTNKLLKKKQEEQIANLLAAKSIVNEKIIKKLDGDYEKYPSIFDYCIVYREELINNELLLYLLKHYQVDYILNILMMNKELNDDIVLKILEKPNFERIYLGEKPYDYRYYILKREEISEEIKNDILKTYEKEELEDIVDEIDLDFQDECSLNKIYTKEDFIKNAEVYKKYIVLTLLKNYLSQKVHKK